MPYAEGQIIAALRQARLEKGLSQRDLAKRAGVAQSYISRIEKGTVDLQLSSLLDLARALDLELMPVSRKLVPAVETISRTAAPPTADERNWSLHELKRLQRTVRRLSATSRTPDLETIERVATELANFAPGEIQREKIERISDMLEARDQTDANKAKFLHEAAQELVRLRNTMVHGGHQKPERQRPAYSLKDAIDDA